jgi:hypothetical protein
VIYWCSQNANSSAQQEHTHKGGRDEDLDEGEVFIGDDENSLFDMLLVRLAPV